MYNYLQELFCVFFREPGCEDLEHEIIARQKEVRAQLDQSGRKVLLQWTDLQNDLTDKLMLNAFLCGFRLATGIAAELSQPPPFSFDEAEEHRACPPSAHNAPLLRVDSSLTSGGILYEKNSYYDVYHSGSPDLSEYDAS